MPDPHESGLGQAERLRIELAAWRVRLEPYLGDAWLAPEREILQAFALELWDTLVQLDAAGLWPPLPKRR